MKRTLLHAAAAALALLAFFVAVPALWVLLTIDGCMARDARRHRQGLNPDMDRQGV